MGDKTEVVKKLSRNKIRYQIKTINRNHNNSTRSRLGTFGEEQELSYEYIIYVHKKDYENAKYILSE